MNEREAVAVAVSQALPGNRTSRVGRPHTRWYSMAYRVAALREVTLSLL
jgi:hypothetical protein